MKRIAIILLVLLATPASASAVTLINPDGTSAEPFQTWANEMRVPTPNATIVIVFDENVACGELAPSEYAGCAIRPWAGRLPEIHIRVAGANCDSQFITKLRVCRDIFAHELGHEFDFLNLTDSDRGAFTSINGESSDLTRWFDPMLPHDARPGEFFANTWAACSDGVDFKPAGLLFNRSVTQYQSLNRLRRSCLLVRKTRVHYRMRISRDADFFTNIGITWQHAKKRRKR